MLGITFPLDFVKEVLLSLQEEGVFKCLIDALPPGFVEVVHIELPYEGGKVAMFEKLREHITAELVDVLNYKAVAVVGPADHMVGGVALNNFKEFDQERGHMINRGAVFICWNNCAG